MKTYISSVLIAAAMLISAAHTVGQEQNNAFSQGGTETVTLAASTCSQWITVTLNFKEATWAQTTIQVPSCYDWWNGAKTAEGQSLNRMEAGQWQVDPETYEMVWQLSEPAGGIDAGQDYPMTITALSF